MSGPVDATTETMTNSDASEVLANPSVIRDRFANDKRDLFAQTQTYLNATTYDALTPDPKLVEKLRSDTVEAVKSGDFCKALRDLEKMRDARTGVITTEIPNPNGTPILVRDARKCEPDPATRGTEAFEVQCLNNYRAAIDVAKLEGKGDLAKNLQKEASKFIQTFHQAYSEELGDLSSEKSQKFLSGSADQVTESIAKLMEKGEVEAPRAKLSLARDFQNFNDEHHNIVTLSSLVKEGARHTVIEAEVAQKSLTDEQISEYNNRKDSTWYKAASGFEQKLIDEYSDIIAQGNHVIPTQTRGSLPGMRNAFEKTTACVESGSKEIEILHTAKHAGTLASFVKDKNVRQELTNQNARQAQEWVGEDVKLHCNTLNSKRPGGEDTEIINRTTKAMEEINGRETNTAFNAFRYAGLTSDLTGAKDFLKAFSENLDQVKPIFKISLEDSDKTTKEALQENKKALKVVQNNLKPAAGILGRMGKAINALNPFSNAEKEFDKALETLKKSGIFSDKDAAIVQDAAELTKNVEKADSWIRWGDKENVSSKVSKGLGLLTNKINSLNPSSISVGFESTYEDIDFNGPQPEKQESSKEKEADSSRREQDLEENTFDLDAWRGPAEGAKKVAETKLQEDSLLEDDLTSLGDTESDRDSFELPSTHNLNFKDFQREEMLTMCASGKDRTGLAMHDQTADVLANRFKMDINDVDKQILPAAHTAQQAGSVYAGGGTGGCHGTKSENLAGIPASRIHLDAIVEPSSKNNKIKGAKEEKKALYAEKGIGVASEEHAASKAAIFTEPPVLTKEALEAAHKAAAAIYHNGPSSDKGSDIKKPISPEVNVPQKLSGAAR